MDRPDFTFDWNTIFINYYAEKHVEKWVEMIGWHYQQYSSHTQSPALAGGTLPATVISTPRGPVRLTKLERKTMSGDVSGTIAEALMAYLLRTRYRLPQPDVIHLRSVKRRSPDFFIRRITRALADDVDPMNWRIVAPPLPIEAKGISKMDNSVIASRLSSGFDQIEQVRTQYGLVGVFVRDPIKRRYHTLLVVIQP